MSKKQRKALAKLRNNLQDEILRRDNCGTEALILDYIDRICAILEMEG